ncbi:type II toxin-antitoxin system HigB family toxin [Pedobacter alpinus]|uniref:Type II toxin-antitoxin system HigB family toxin n=1 Tax=Pedobacter alpinus TaxID=1590643 RepID=A0ABW5TPT4_9SPHI
MRVIAKKILVTFFIKHASAKANLEAWFLEISESDWSKPEDVIKDYPTADVITGKRIVFNINGNHYRLIVDIEFKLRLVFIVWVGTHAAYDKINVKEVKYVESN